MNMLPPHLIEFFDCLKLPNSQIQFGHLQDVVATDVSKVYLGQPENLYFVPGVHHKKTGRASDRDIMIKNWFFVDIDIRKEMKLGNTETDTQKVMEICEKIAERLEGSKFENYALANFTGNGLHLHYIGDPINITPKNAEAWKQGYKILLSELDEYTGVPSDKACGNVGRLCRIPGTYNLKNGNCIRGEILALDLTQRFVSLESILDLGEKEKGEASENATQILTPVPHQLMNDEEDVYQLILKQVRIEDLVVRHLWNGQRWTAKEEGERICFYDASRDRKGCYVQKSTNMLINGGTHHFQGNHSPYTFAEKIMGLRGREVFEFFEQFNPVIRRAAEKNRKALSLSPSTKSKSSKVPQKKSIDQVASEVLEKHDLVLDVHSGVYYENVGHRWKKLPKAQLGAYVNAFDNDQNQTNQRVASIIGKIGRIQQKIDTQWNITPQDCLAVRGHIINLKSGEIYPVKRDNWMDWAITPEYDPTAQCPLWEKCLEDWFGKDPDGALKYKVLQEFFGYALMNHHNFPKALFLYGKSQSGKSTIGYVLEELIFGSRYSASLNIEKLSDHRELSKLQGVRINIMSELDGKKVDCGGLKSLTGGDRQMIDPKYQHATSYRTTAKHVLISNNFPFINDPSWATHERLLMLPFLFEITEKDRSLRQKLAKEAAGIVNWATVGGKRLLSQNGFTEIPKTVGMAKDESLNQNLVVTFFREFCVEDKGSYISCGDLEQAIKEHFGKRLPTKQFGEAYDYLGIRRKQKKVEGIPNPRRCLEGYRLVNSPSIVNRKNKESAIID